MGCHADWWQIRIEFLFSSVSAAQVYFAGSVSQGQFLCTSQSFEEILPSLIEGVLDLKVLILDERGVRGAEVRVVSL